MQHDNRTVSSTSSMFHPNSNSALSTPTAPPPPYSDPSQYPPTSGMPYPQQYPPPAPVVGYHQPYAPAPGGQQYYPPPGVVNPGPPLPSYQAPQPQQQQQQQVVVVNSQPTAVAPVPVRAPVSMVGAIVLSCFVFWCCGWLCGGIAFILALVGESSASAGDAHGAIQMRKASYGLSIAGIVCAVIIIIAVVAANVHAASNPRYSYTTRSTLSRCYNSYSGYYYYC